MTSVKSGVRTLASALRVDRLKCWGVSAVCSVEGPMAATHGPAVSRGGGGFPSSLGSRVWAWIGALLPVLGPHPVLGLPPKMADRFQEHMPRRARQRSSTLVTAVTCSQGKETQVLLVPGDVAAF